MKQKQILTGLLVFLMVLTLLPMSSAAAGGLQFETEIWVDSEIMRIPRSSLSGDVTKAFEGSFMFDEVYLTDAEVEGDEHVSVDALGDGRWRLILEAPGSGTVTVTTAEGETYAFPVTVYGDTEDTDLPSGGGTESEIPEEEEPEPELIWSEKGTFAVSEEHDTVSLTTSEGFTFEKAVLVGESAEFAELEYTEEEITISFPYGWVGDRLRVRAYFNEMGYNTTVSLRLKNDLPALVFRQADGTVCEALTLPRGEKAEGRFVFLLPDGSEAEAERLDLPDIVDHTEAEGGLVLTGADFGEDTASADYNGRTYRFPIKIDLPILAFYSGKTASIDQLIEEYTVEEIESTFYLIAGSPIENAMMDAELTSIAALRQIGSGKVVAVTLWQLPEDGGRYTVTGEVDGVIRTAGITLYDGVTPPLPVEPSAPEVPETGESSGAGYEPEIKLPFTDVQKGAWYYDAVCWAYEQGIMQGTAPDIFSPDQTVDRAMLVTILWRMEGCPVVNYWMPFGDIPADTWYTEAVRWAAAMGIVKGTSETTFAPLEPLTREQAAVILYRYAGHIGRDLSMDDADLTRFGDHAKVSAYADTAVRWAVCHRYLNGDGQDLLPRDSMERSQLAQLMMNFAE